jgi:HSP20 family protein
MNLPIHRRAKKADDERDFEHLRRSLLADLDRWPGFADELISHLGDVVPLADVEESEAYVVDIELPGVRRDDVAIEIANGQLSVTAERRERQRVGLLRRTTRTTGRFRLQITLPQEVDADAVTASLDHGMLTVTVPKAARARRRRIPIGRPSR